MEQTMVATEKRPAHEVVIRLIEKTSKDLHAAQGTPSRCKLAGALTAGTYLLGNMKIPHDAVPVVVHRLTEIHRDYPTEVLLLPDVIAAVQGNINPIIAFIANGGDFSSDEGVGLINTHWNTSEGKEFILQALEDDTILAKLSDAMEARKDDAFFRRIAMMIIAEAASF